MANAYVWTKKVVKGHGQGNSGHSLSEMANYYRRKKADAVFLNAKPLNSANAQAYLYGVRKYSTGLAERLDADYEAPPMDRKKSSDSRASNNPEFTPVSGGSSAVKFPL